MQRHVAAFAVWLLSLAMVSAGMKFCNRICLHYKRPAMLLPWYRYNLCRICQKGLALGRVQRCRRQSNFDSEQQSHEQILFLRCIRNFCDGRDKLEDFLRTKFSITKSVGVTQCWIQSVPTATRHSICKRQIIFIESIKSVEIVNKVKSVDADRDKVCRVLVVDGSDFSSLYSADSKYATISNQYGGANRMHINFAYDIEKKISSLA